MLKLWNPPNDEYYVANFETLKVLTVRKSVSHEGSKNYASSNLN